VDGQIGRLSTILVEVSNDGSGRLAPDVSPETGHSRRYACGDRVTNRAVANAILAI